MSTPALTFTGISSFSSDFQTILSREQQIEQIPITRLQNTQSDNTQKVQLLQGLNSAVAALSTSIGSLGSVGANKALTASSSDPASISVSNTGATQAVSYTISDCTSIATAASEKSVTGYADTTTTPVSQHGNLSLVFGSGDPIPITLTSDQNNLVGLRDYINNMNAGLTATILTTGTGATPNYLVVSSNTLGATTLQINDTDAGTDLLTNTNQGSDAVFKLNGIPIDKTSNTINDVIPGVTFTLNQQPSSDVTLNLSPDSSQISNALNDLTTKYNAVVDLIDAQMGSGAGLLNGDQMVLNIADDLRQLTTYNGGSNMSLAQLGVTFDTSGKMSFDPNAVSSLSDSQLSSAISFLGSSTTGLGAFAATFNQLSDPISGLIQTEESGLNQENQQLTDQIDTLNTRMSVEQAGITTRLQQADAAIAALESQQQILNASVQSVDLALFGKDFGTGSVGG